MALNWPDSLPTSPWLFHGCYQIGTSLSRADFLLRHRPTDPQSQLDTNHVWSTQNRGPEVSWETTSHIRDWFDQIQGQRPSDRRHLKGDSNRSIQIHRPPGTSWMMSWNKSSDFVSKAQKSLISVSKATSWSKRVPVLYTTNQSKE